MRFLKTVESSALQKINLIYFACDMKTHQENNFKKVHERQWLDAFKKVFEGFPSGRIIATESPDFIVQVNPKQRIGIEITKYDLYEPDEQLVLSSFVDAERMALLIEKKNEKRGLYQKKWLNAYWLLILINTGEHKDILRFSDRFMSHYQNITRFDRLFVFDYLRRQLYF